MTIASTSKTRVAYVAEATYGAGPPTTPTFQTFRRTNGNLQTSKSTVTSEEIQPDRNIRAELQTGQDVRGSYDFEMSYGTLDDMLANVMHSSWSTNAIVNGSADASLCFEEMTDIGGGALAYSEFDGCVVDELDLSISSRAKITGTATIMGLQEQTRSAIITGATYAAPNSNGIMTASQQFASLVVGTLSPAPKIKSLSLKIANNTRVEDAVGSLFSYPFGVGSFEVTGSFNAYFESLSLYQQVLAHGGGALTFGLGSVTTKKYSLNMPFIQFLSGARQLGGRNSDVMVTVPFRAIYDAGIGGTLQITRALA